MSNFTRKMRHIATGKVEDAHWLDNHFGPREYGVSFSFGTFRPNECEAVDSGNIFKKFSKLKRK